MIGSMAANMVRPRTSILDDRGRVVRVDWDRTGPRRAEGEEGEGERRAPRRRVVLAWMCLVGSFTVLAVCFIYAGRLFAGMLGLVGVGGTTLVIGGLVAVVFVWARFRAGWVATRTERKAKRGQRDRSLLMFVRVVIRRLGACPACGYGLGELVVEHDGCVVCPECGGAWWRDSWSDDGGVYDPPARVLKPNARVSQPAVMDARGVTLALVPERRVRERRRMVVEAIGPWRWTQWAVWVVSVLIGLGVLCVLIGVVFITMDARAAGVVGTIGGVLLLWGVWATRRTLGWRRGCRSLAGALVREGICPACEGVLRDEASFSDGAVICARCGAAWEPPVESGIGGIRSRGAAV